MLSPTNYYVWHASIHYLNKSGILTSSSTSNRSAGLRPVLSLKQGTVLSSGSGTSTSPYIVE